MSGYPRIDARGREFAHLVASSGHLHTTWGCDLYGGDLITVSDGLERGCLPCPTCGDLPNPIDALTAQVEALTAQRDETSEMLRQAGLLLWKTRYGAAIAMAERIADFLQRGVDQ